MTMVTIKSPPNLNHFREASFSSYLNGEDKSFILKLASQKDDEIGVFNAERYFNGTMDHDDKSPLKNLHEKIGKKHPLKEDEHVSMNLTKLKIATPSVRSERSEASWNSQSFLLQSGLKNSGRSTSKTSKSFFSSLGCKCACSDKDSVKTDDKRSERKFTIDSTTSAEQNPKRVSQNSIKIQVKKVDKMVESKHRNSKEVTESWEKGSNSWMVEKRLSMLNWDFDKTDNPPPDDGNIIGDSMSDASSDLFEIESLKGRDGLYYAPSEASIEWSVVTASVADFPVMSDFDELKSAKLAANYGKRVAKKAMPRGRSNAMLGCKSDKSVRIAEDVHKTSKPETRFRD